MVFQYLLARFSLLWMSPQHKHAVPGFRDRAAMRASRYSAWRALLLDMVFPPKCPLTHENVGAHGDLSPAGWRQVSFIEDPFCDHCGAPFTQDFGAGIICGLCISEPPAFDRARAAIVYNDAAHDLIVAFKYSDRVDFAPMFAKWLGRIAGDVITDRSFFVPVPLHPRRLFSRRYNQAALLAQMLSRNNDVPCHLDMVYRNRATQPQQQKSLVARRRNVAGAFSVRESDRDIIRGAHIVLVDDVLTTGATMSAVASVLKRAGAAKVDALAVARVAKMGAGTI